MDSNHASSTFFGLIAGIYAAVSETTQDISWEIVLYTAILATVGGIFGWCASELMKFLKPIIKNLFSKLFKNDKSIKH